MLATSSLYGGYRIGKHYPGIYLSYTELQIIVGLLRGKECERIALEIGISRRSVDYCCCNMMKLMGCQDLDDLIDCVKESELYDYIEC